MVKKRKSIPRLTTKKLYQECGSTCSFCPERDVATFEVHHIDEDPSNSDLANLIIVCSSCHTRITKGVFSPTDVVTRKRQQTWCVKPQATSGSSVNVSINDSTFTGDIAQNITKIKTTGRPKIMHPAGSIGADIPMKAYIDYLLKRYYKYKSADKSYGVKKRFSHAVIHGNIQKKFGAKTFFLPTFSFLGLVDYLRAHIDGTIQGKCNTKIRRRNYHTFEKHCQTHKLKSA